jgi:hypothetical protein
LIAYDRRILWNGFRQNYALWRDRLTLILIIAVSYGYLRSLGTTLTGARLVVMSITAGALAGATALWVVKRRLAFHAAETPLAADALNQAAICVYMRAWLGSALTVSSLAFAIVSWTSLPLFIASFAIGAGLATIIPDHRPATGRALKLPAVRRGIRMVAALLVATLLWFVMTQIQGADRSILATVLLLAGIQLLTPLDATTVRFEGICGVSLVSSFRRHLGPAVLWYGAVLLIGATQEGAAGQVPFAIAGGVLLVHVARLLAYRVTSERTSLLIIGGGLVLCGTIAMLSPGDELLALPVGLCGLLWLFLRALRDRWLIA